MEPEKTRTIDIEAFVELEQIDPIYYDHPYYLAPGPGATKAYGLLLKALEDTDRVGIARVVIRSKEALVAIRAHQNVLTMETMLFGDEVVAPSELGELPDPKDVKAAKKEVDMARQLIESLSTEFDPDAFRDTYRDRVLEMIEAKSEGQEIEMPETPEAPEEVPDLMAALEASIAGTKRQGGQAEEARAAKKGSSSKASSNGSKKSGSKSKPKRKTAAKK